MEEWIRLAEHGRDMFKCKKKGERMEEAVYQKKKEEFFERLGVMPEGPGRSLPPLMCVRGSDDGGGIY